MAELPDESAVVAGLEDHRLSEIAEEDEYLQLKELTPTEPNPSSSSGATIGKITLFAYFWCITVG